MRITSQSSEQLPAPKRASLVYVRPDRSSVLQVWFCAREPPHLGRGHFINLGVIQNAVQLQGTVKDTQAQTRSLFITVSLY